MQFKLIPAFTLAALSLASPVLGADLNGMQVYRAAPPVFTAFSWTGFYAGAQMGYATGYDVTKEYDTPTRAFVGLQNYFRPGGFLAGIHAGYNFQFGRLVAGVEADAEITDIHGGFTDPPVAPFNPGGYGATRINFQGSIRARLGYAFDRTLLYVTGGPSFAQIESKYTNWALTSEKFTRTVTGATFGGGVEHAVTNYLTLRGEYRFTAYPRFWNDSLIAFPGFSGTQHPRNHSFRVGVSYKF